MLKRKTKLKKSYLNQLQIKMCFMWRRNCIFFLNYYYQMHLIIRSLIWCIIYSVKHTNKEIGQRYLNTFKFDINYLFRSQVNMNCVKADVKVPQSFVDRACEWPAELFYLNASFFQRNTVWLIIKAHHDMLVWKYKEMKSDEIRDNCI